MMDEADEKGAGAVPSEVDEDRAAIFARRQRLIARALAAIGTAALGELASGCPPMPCLEPVPGDVVDSASRQEDTASDFDVQGIPDAMP